MTADRNEPHLLEEVRGDILLLTLNRPEARNAISPQMACRLSDAYARYAEDDRLRVLVLTGAGDRAFCSGGDLALTMPLLTGAREPQDDWDLRVLEDPAMMDRSALRHTAIDKPIVAAINGACVAGGMETMLATDIRIAAETARFGLPEARRGLIPFAGSLARLPRQIPHALAMEMLLTGDLIDAERALSIGLVNRVVPQAEVLARALCVAETIADNGPLAIRQIKRTVRLATGVPLEQGFALEDEAKRVVMASEDAREGPRAFMEKRPARFTGR
ncbi:enoyl-CoA hydratase-related protein [Aurantimonas sp. 22II-16-19i]|uniref:enoyl-CoA hydratase-related protein n=1 Tax=Aurantimonas sp. 22II-16-19i TaxID=1317114 RepID=UPI0009F7B6AE|nr:enoyl-CoA hydratase-related protein [Aurantimonas sp. 22II-16-19i]ORE98114.1 enoyl-CoA hydratase/isomerase [Aurantimonas sp. 22II-16-19i]